MNPDNRVAITDTDGWQKEFPLQKSLIHIGSDLRNDIVLDSSRGAGVSPRHLQLVAMAGEQAGYRAINLGDAEILVGDSEESVPPRSATSITNGQLVKIGDFRLVFRIGAEWETPHPLPEAAIARSTRPEPITQPSGPTVQHVSGLPAEKKTSASIGLKLSLPTADLEPDKPIEGIIAIQNLGDEPGVQFRLEVTGLEPDCYEVGPGPILFPNAEKGVYLRIRHPRGPCIPAGKRTISVRATAPEAYSGESVEVSQVLEILPYYRHTLHLVPVD